jgi:hypothetical protein
MPMSNVHVLARSDGLYTMAFHIPIPAGNNSAGLAWSAVLIKSGVGGTTVIPDGTGTDGGISSTEKAALAAGTLFEVVDQVDIGGLSGAPLAAFIDARFAARTTEAQARLSAQLQWYGQTR